MERPLISAVVPVYNEAENVRPLYVRLAAVLESITPNWQLLFVDDGSEDGSARRVEGLRARDARVELIEFSRNFGKEMAMLAGYDRARGQCVVVLDGDLQTPPELIPDMIRKWKDGASVVDAVRTRTEKIGLLRRKASDAFYWLFQKVCATRITPNCVDFRLMDHSVVDHLRRCRERFRFNRGLVNWVGFPHASVEFVADERSAGRSRWGFWKLLRYATDAILSFSWFPLRLAGLGGMLISLLSFVYLAILTVDHFVSGTPFQGYHTVAGGIFFLGGVQLLTIWILGEYVGRIYTHSQARPPYVCKRYLGPRCRAAPEEADPAHLAGENSRVLAEE